MVGVSLHLGEEELKVVLASHACRLCLPRQGSSPGWFHLCSASLGSQAFMEAAAAVQRARRKVAAMEGTRAASSLVEVQQAQPFY